jgi:hypothetical protein
MRAADELCGAYDPIAITKAAIIGRCRSVPRPGAANARRGRKLSSVERLVRVLRETGFEIPAKYVLTRHRPGPWQRSAGAWSWSISMVDPYFEVGSPDSVKALLKAKHLEQGLDGTVYAG